MGAPLELGFGFDGPSDVFTQDHGVLGNGEGDALQVGVDGVHAPGSRFDENFVFFELRRTRSFANDARHVDVVLPEGTVRGS